MKTIKSKGHPEIRSGEVFLTNSKAEDFVRIGWSSKRRGDFAYDTDGKVCGKSPNFFPVFVSKVELTDAGFEIVN